MTTRWGASAEDWAAWQRLGLTADLLPYVANPKAVIAPYSTMKRLGKTPALYDRHHQVHGFVKWQEHVASARDIERWSADGDYGICLQGRRIRAWDIDVPDPVKSKAIADAIMDIGGALPVRSRSDSGKILLAFEIAGDWFKDVLAVDGGKVEFLAQGQQFLVTGRHEDGARYVWDGPSGLPSGFPVWTAETVREVKDALELVFGSEGWSAGGEGGRARLRSEDLDVEDEVATWLVESWETFGAQGEKLFVLCPWKDGHSLDSGETEASWLLRGTRGYERGHFKCLHASCASRGREEFLEAVGYTQSGFDVIEAPNPGAAPREAEGVLGRNDLALPLPGFDRKDNGVVKATLDNVARACEFEEVTGRRFARDTFREALMVSEKGVWRPIMDVDPTRVRRFLETRRSFETIGKETMRDAIEMVAEDNRFDSAIQWIEGLAPWDGVERCARLLPDYMGTADTPYTRAVGRYAMTAHAGRVVDPGCKVDMIIALTGPQGQTKSSAIFALAPRSECAAELSLNKIDADLSRKMRGIIVAEIAELRGLNSTDAESIRAWITQRQDAWIPKFKEQSITFLRRLVLWSTTNTEEFLADPTGERRWLPAEVERDCDPEAVERDRDQLWAEGLHLYRQGGVAWKEAMTLAKNEHARFKIGDSWDNLISDWLNEKDIAGVTTSDGEFRTDHVARQALGLDMARFGKREEMRIGKILRDFGFERVVKRESGSLLRVWARVKG